jgi:tetratricopeptide (TPR) repeat protein
MMASHTRGQARRWRASFIIAIFLVAVAGAASVGWWYARESPPHQGPIVVLSVDGVAATDFPVYGAPRSDMPAIDALSSESVVFERAYTHSPLSLPAHASLLTGRLPYEHGVRDDAGFSIAADTRTLAELMRNRGFATGAAVSSFLLHERSGIARGFGFFDEELPAGATGEAAALERPGSQTFDAAEEWMASQSGQRFFLFVQVAGRDADATVGRLTGVLKQRGWYDDATIVLVGDRGDVGSGLSLDDRALRVPLIVKQPGGRGGHRRVPFPVQGVDVAPTILDLVRAPLPAGLAGRSLRPVLDDGEAHVAIRPIYSESLAAYFRFGGQPVYALTGDRFRYVRGIGEDLVPVSADEEASVGESTEAARLRESLDRILAAAPTAPAVAIQASEEDRYAQLGYLSPDGPVPSGDSALDRHTQVALVDQHRAAAMLIGQKKYAAGIRALQAIVDAHPELVTVRYQLGVLLARTGRIEEAIQVFGAIRELRPDSSTAARAMADALLRADKINEAREEAAIAVALAEEEGGAALFAAHDIAARAAMADRDRQSATEHAEAAYDADSSMPVPQFIEGRLLYIEGRYEEAAEALQRAADLLQQRQRTLADLHLYLGESLARLDRYVDAEAHFRDEIRDYPRSIQAYTSLAMLYRASNRDGAVEDVLNEMVASTPTPEGYAVAARLWIILGDSSRAEALRSDARTRFSDDPSLALLGRGRR